MSIPRFEHLFRVAAGLDVDKSDLRRYEDFVDRAVADVLTVAQETASANGRDVILPIDLRLSRALRDRVREFERLDGADDLLAALERLVAVPPLDLALSEEAQAQLPRIAGGLSIALARAFSIVDPNVRNPQTQQWERVVRLFDLVL
jgi:hypothetical protein